MSEFQVGIRTKTFNYNLHKAFRATGKTRPVLSEELGIAPNRIRNFLYFREFPSPEEVERIALYLNVMIEAIFPDHISGFTITSQPEDLALTMSQARQFGLIQGAPDLQELVEQTELTDLVADVLTTLTDREQFVINERFGLGDNGNVSNTFEEIAKKVGVTRERIRQIEIKALKKLRHPMRSNVLRDYVDANYDGGEE